MDEIAMDTVECRTGGRLLLRKGFGVGAVRANRSSPGNGYLAGRSEELSNLPPSPEADDESGRVLESADREARTRTAGSQTGNGGVSAEAAEALIVHKRIGERIKSLRQRKHMGLVELGRYTGLSASFLSQLETGRVVPTLRNLSRIAMVFSRDLSFFFEPERPELFRIGRSSERQRQPQTGADKPGYFFESLGHVPTDQRIAPYVAEFLPNGERHSPAAHQHTGAEFLYVLSGHLRLTHEGRTETLEWGDAVYFDASAKHSYERLGDEPCSALILTMPEPLNNNQTNSQADGQTATRPAGAVQTGSNNGYGAGYGAGGQKH